MTDTFTLEELLTALQGAMTDGDDQPDAVRMEDLIAASPFGKDKLRAQLIPLIRAGSVECVKVRHTRIDGAVTWVPAYRLVKHDRNN